MLHIVPVLFQQDLELGWEQVSAVVWRRMGLESTS
jgi:hypothetical protein